MVKMRVVPFQTLLIATLLLLVLSFKVDAQCSRIKDSWDALFITFERADLVETETKKMKDGVILRLHNNTTCTIVLTTGRADKFYKPLPPNPTAKQRAFREIDYDLPDGVLVPQVQYSYSTQKSNSHNVLGDMVFGFRLLGGRSILFEVPFEHIELSFITELRLPYKYPWEEMGEDRIQGSGMESYVRIWNDALPEAIKQKIKKR